MGWRLTPAGKDAEGFEIKLDVTRRESGSDAAPERGVGVHAAMHWRARRARWGRRRSRDRRAGEGSADARTGGGG